MDSSRRPIYGSPEHQKGVFMRNIIDSRALFPSKGATKTHTHANQTDRQIKSIKHKREAKARQRKLESLVAEKNAEIRQLNKALKQSRETRYKTSPPYHPVTENAKCVVEHKKTESSYTSIINSPALNTQNWNSIFVTCNYSARIVIWAKVQRFRHSDSSHPPERSPDASHLNQ